LDTVVKKYMLRRRKDNTISEQLPKKVDNIVFCQLTEFQLRAYKYIPR
jgi:SNF2 family DNA or RNA helicase